MSKKNKVVGVEEIKKILKTEKYIIGTDRTIKAIKLGKIKKVLLASNCKEETRKDIKYYSSIGKFDIIESNLANDELGVVCKKSFPISIIGILK